MDIRGRFGCGEGGSSDCAADGDDGGSGGGVGGDDEGGVKVWAPMAVLAATGHGDGDGEGVEDERVKIDRFGFLWVGRCAASFSARTVSSPVNSNGSCAGCCRGRFRLPWETARLPGRAILVSLLFWFLLVYRNGR